MASSGNHLLDGSIGKGFYKEAQDKEKHLEDMRERLMTKYDDMFPDELGEMDRMKGNHLKLEVKSEGVTSYHCWTPVEVYVNYKKEARRMVQSMVNTGILEEVDRATKWCVRGFFAEKPSSGGKLCLVTDYQSLNKNWKTPVWPFLTTERIGKSLISEDR